MGKTADEGISDSVFRPIAVVGNLSRLYEAANAANRFVFGDKPLEQRLEEVWADLPKHRAGFNIAGRVLAIREGKFLEISIATSETLTEIPDDGACEMTFLVREPAKCEDMRSSLDIGDLIEVRGAIVPFAYLEDDGQRVVSLTLVARNVNVVEAAQR
jgi:lysyl-tRNA synthetase class II